MRLVVAKSKIAPKHRATVPRLELCGAVMRKRLAEFVDTELQQPFSAIFT